MNQHILIREMNKDDYKNVLDLVLETWKYNEWAPEKIAVPMAQYFLSDALSHATHSLIAEVNGHFAGIISVKIYSDKSINEYCEEQKLESLLSITHEMDTQPSLFNQYLTTKKMNQKMLEEAEHQYQGSIVLLMLENAYKGFGLGTKLYSLAIDFFKENNVRSFYLFTDSASNYKFYDSKGLSRINQSQHQWDKDDQESIETYYLYEGHVL